MSLTGAKARPRYKNRKRESRTINIKETRAQIEKGTLFAREKKKDRRPKEKRRPKAKMAKKRPFAKGRVETEESDIKGGIGV